ncbi:unnamed protein product [Ilex paraguariensis]|uniref:Uncharacterized protein n=1 Tax=Ilex paraguariensis TaxID=185542 RepID=A0ABC8SMP8_9AQUA
MEIKAGASDNVNSTHNQSSSSHSFTEQALRAGLLGNMENIGRRGYFVGGGCSDVTEARIIREIEKRKIREDIVAAGASLLRQRELEEEVFKELMMEREIALRRGDRFSLLSSPFSSLQSHFWGSSLNWRDGFGHGERLSLVNQLESGADGRLSVVNQLGGGGFPFQRREPGATNGVGLKPVIDLRKGNTMSLGGECRKWPNDVKMNESGLGNETKKCSRLIEHRGVESLEEPADCFVYGKWNNNYLYQRKSFCFLEVRVALSKKFNSTFTLEPFEVDKAVFICDNIA